MEISKKKPNYPIHPELRSYLRKYRREAHLAATYEALLQFSNSIPVLDQEGKDTLWQSVIYDNYLQAEVQKALVEIYAALKTDGDQSFVGQLRTDRIDHCLFGNSNPFRIRIVNTINDHFIGNRKTFLFFIFFYFISKFSSVLFNILCG